jgi:hypothetical protein
MRFPNTFLLAAALTFTICAMPAGAQDNLQIRFDNIRSTVNINANRADIREVVRQLFSQIGAPKYEMDRSLRGYVTLNQTNLLRDTILRMALEQVGANFTIQNGVYLISAGRQDGRPGSPDSRDRRDIQFNALTVREAAQLIGEKYGRKIRTAGNLPGRVTLNLRDATFDQAVRALLDASRSQWPLETRRDGDWIVLIPIENLPKPEDMPESFRKLVNLSVQNASIPVITSQLWRQTGINVTLDRDVPKDLRVSVVAKNEPFWTVVQRMAVAAGLKVDRTSPTEVWLKPLPSVVVDRGGRPVGSVREEYGTCRSCRYDLKREWAFCPMCGEKVRR